MFVAEALADFSSLTMKAAENESKQQRNESEEDEQNAVKQVQEKDDDEKQIKSQKRDRNEMHSKQLEECEKDKEKEKEGEQKVESNETELKYSQFKCGDKVLVKETYENGWWLGHPVGKPQLQGFFPSNYVKLGIKPPAPAPPKSKLGKAQKEQEMPEYDPNDGTDWIKKQLDGIKTGPVKSDYYQGIKGYKMVKIDQKNQNILKGNHVQFDVATGLARVPVKDQAPTAKAVRQMGYYFDYHQWNQTMNQNPHRKSRPDPKKKKAKKLNLKMMD